MKKLVVIIICFTFLLSSCKTSEVVKQSNEEKWFDSSVIYEVNIRQYTKSGTFNAFREHLPRLKELGVDILWLMPINPISEKNRKGTLGSYYSISDYKKVNPEFGTIHDFNLLVTQAHNLGMKIILDWVPNHTGWDNNWINEHPEWYTREGGKIIHPAGTDWTDVADLNYDNFEMRDAMIDSMAFWVTNSDVDGFRCDVAGSVPSDFWNKASMELNSIKPLFMLAEDSSNYALLQTAFNSNYNWSMLHAMEKAATGNGNKAAIKDIIRQVESRYPSGTFPMNFITNHDENTWNGTAYKRFGNSKDLMTALTFLIPGIPLIYSGQEAGLDKSLKFFEKDEISWADLSESELLKKLISIKKENTSLYNGAAGGSIKFINCTERSILAFIREREDSRVLFIGNFNKEKKEFNLREFSQPSEYRNGITDEVVDIATNQGFSLEGFEFKIYVK